MKLASLQSARDGRLVIVSRDLSRAVAPAGVASTLQQALDRWQTSEPLLSALARRLDAGEIESVPFDERACAAPLPRAYQWADGSAYVNHVELVRRARGAELPDSFWTDPLIYQGGSDTFYGPREDIELADEAWGIDFEAEVAVITDDVPMGVDAAAAKRHIKLYMLVNDVSLRNLVPGELAKGFGFFQSKPSTAFSPCAVTPDELGTALEGDAIRLPLRVDLNAQPFGRARPDVDRTFTFPELLAHAARTRALGAGTIIGSGTISNKLEGEPGKPIAQGGVGYSCIAEQRSVETILYGAPRTDFLRFGDRVQIQMLDDAGRSIFGRIDQTLRAYTGPGEK